jgi:hypothetical protein
MNMKVIIQSIMLLAGAAMFFASCEPKPYNVAYIPDVKYAFTLPSLSSYKIGETEAVPGCLYSIDTSEPGDVVYLAGNLPIIISVPHGGTALPDIPDRDTSCPDGINTGNDVNTIELAWDIVEALMNSTNGKYPHVIINNLARIKVDQNRAWGENCNPVSGRGGEAWNDFHERFISTVAINAVLEKHGTGLYIDLHGKPDDYGGAVMVGYNLTSTVLFNSDDTIDDPANGYADKSSLRFLSMKLGAKIDFAELLRGCRRGHESFGTLLQKGLDSINKDYAKEYTVVPRDNLKSPLPYLSGEYNVQAFCGVLDGSIDNEYGYTASRFISGFQLEVARDIRVSDPVLRKDFARKVAAAVKKYLFRNFRIGI